MQQTPSYDPAGDWQAGWVAEFEAETDDKGTDIPGVVGNHVKLKQLKVYYRPNNTWTDMNDHQSGDDAPTGEPHPCYYNKTDWHPLDPTDGTYFGIWTGARTC